MPKYSESSKRSKENKLVSSKRSGKEHKSASPKSSGKEKSSGKSPKLTVGNFDKKTCEKNKKDDIISLAKRVGVSTKGTKKEICEKLQEELGDKYEKKINKSSNKPVFKQKLTVANFDKETCKEKTKDDIVSLAKRVGISTKGTKKEICEKLQEELGDKRDHEKLYILKIYKKFLGRELEEEELEHFNFESRYIFFAIQYLKSHDTSSIMKKYGHMISHYIEIKHLSSFEMDGLLLIYLSDTIPFDEVVGSFMK